MVPTPRVRGAPAVSLFSRCRGGSDMVAAALRTMRGARGRAQCPSKDTALACWRALPPPHREGDRARC
eukprot:4068851-Pyramimonas_sp.AAC.1